MKKKRGETIKTYGKLKERTETKYIKVVQQKLEDKDPDVILKNSKKNGYLFFPHHYLITEDGTISKFRPEESVAFGEIKDYDVTVSILCDTSEESEVALEIVLNALEEKYEGVEVIGH